MRFLDGVRSAVRRATRREPWPPLERMVDTSELRVRLHALIDGQPREQARSLADAWSGSTLELFVEWLAPQLLSLGLARANEELGPLLAASLPAFVLDVPAQGLSATATAEIERIRQQFPRGSDLEQRVMHDGWRVPVLYAEHLGLMRAGVLMPPGQMLLALDELAARRWLLTLEVQTCSGPTDPWRTSAAHLAVLVDRPQGRRGHGDEEPDRFWPRPRLVALDLVRETADYRSEYYEVSDSALAEIRAILDTTSPMWSLARALIPDPGTAVPTSAGTSFPIGARQASRAAAELAQATAHELNNIVPQIEGALENLGTVVKGTTVEASATTELVKLTESVERLYRYAGWFQTLGDGLDRPPERFGARAMLEESALLANGGTIEMALEIPAELSLYGLRDRITLALVNLLRNARQHGAKRVRLSARTEQQQLYIEVDDDGPGVPDTRVPEIFVAPFTTREDGTGQGLPLAKRIIEEEHRGSLGYSPSPLGGARFTIRLPI